MFFGNNWKFCSLMDDLTCNNVQMNLVIAWNYSWMLKNGNDVNRLCLEILVWIQNLIAWIGRWTFFLLIDALRYIAFSGWYCVKIRCSGINILIRIIPIFVYDNFEESIDFDFDFIYWSHGESVKGNRSDLGHHPDEGEIVENIWWIIHVVCMLYWTCFNFDSRYCSPCSLS